MADSASGKTASRHRDHGVPRSETAAVQADLVRMHQGAAGQIVADKVELQQSAARDVRGSIVEASQSAVGAVRSNEVTLDRSVAGIVSGDSVKLNGSAGVIAGREVRGERIETLVLISGRVEGEVHTVFNSRQTLVAGLLGGLLAGLILALTRVLFRRE